MIITQMRELNRTSIFQFYQRETSLRRCEESGVRVLLGIAVPHVGRIMQRMEGRNEKNKKEEKREIYQAGVGRKTEPPPRNYRVASSSHLLLPCSQEKSPSNNPVARIILPLADFPLFYITRRISSLLHQRLIRSI